MRKIKVYLSGGMQKFGKENFEESNLWREKVIEHMKFTYPNTFTCFNPNEHFSFKDSERKFLTEREVMDFDLWHLRDSDIVLVNWNDPESKGTSMEVAIAYEMKKPIIGINIDGFELHPWQREMCNRIFVSWIDAIDYIEEHYNS